MEPDSLKIRPPSPFRLPRLPMAGESYPGNLHRRKHPPSSTYAHTKPARASKRQGVDPTAKERESGLCAVDVVGGSGPDILRLMQEKGGYEVPPPVAGPPTVTRVGPTSLQAGAAAVFPAASVATRASILSIARQEPVW